MDFLRRTRTAVATLSLALLAFPLAQGAGPPNEYALKSVFLYNFCHFIEWPESAFSSPNEPMVIGIIGDDPFGKQLAEAVEGETYHNRPIKIEHYRSPKEVRHCQMLFVPRSETSRVDQILTAVAGSSVLTVGETDDFLDHGGMISLPTEHNRVRLRIAPSPVRAANLSVSSKLLRVADVKG
jgi:hypothetical protein